MRSSKLQAVHLNKTLLSLATDIQSFEIGVRPSVVNGEVVVYFSRVAKKFDKFKRCSTINTLQWVVVKIEQYAFAPTAVNCKHTRIFSKLKTFSMLQVLLAFAFQVKTMVTNHLKVSFRDMDD